jgi:hypothetical protein
MSVIIPAGFGSVGATLLKGHELKMKTGFELDPHQQYLANIDQAFNELFEVNTDDPAEMLKKITENGIQSLWKWQVAQLKKRVAEQVMSEMNLTREQIAALPPEQRVEIEKKIMDEVEQRVKQLIEEGMRKKKSDPFALNGNLSSASMQALLEFTGQVKS